MNTVIIGEGAFGKALFSVISQNTDNVTFWKEGMDLFATDILVMAIPTVGIREILSKLRLPKPLIILNGAKGIEQETHQLPFQIVEDVFSDTHAYVSLMGPSFAKEIEKQMPTLVNIGYDDKGVAEKVKKVFETEYFRVRLTKGYEAIELAGAMKNLYAIGCGLSSGLGFKMNTQAKLITLAIDEIYLLCEKMRFSFDTNARPSMIGDVVLSCSSTESRNFTFGKYLATVSLYDAQKKIGKTIEGFHTSFSIDSLQKEAKTSLPFASCIVDILRDQNPTSIRSRFMEFVKEI